MAKSVKTIAAPPPAASVQAGAASRDITPPVGIYNRLWGAAKHDVATGVHRPLEVHVVAFRAGDGPVMLLVSIDGGWFRDRDSESLVREGAVKALGLDPSRMFFNVTHTHAACAISLVYRDRPGGELIEPYLHKMRDQLIDAGRAAIDALAPATLTWAAGRCDLAANRDLPDPTQDEPRFICGYNPDQPADDTLLVGRVTRDGDDAVLATIVNYACHPTTLAWDNSLISPDFVGAMRETVRRHAGGEACVFLQGASGQLGPRHQYVGDTAVADGHGRYLGHCAIAAIEGMLPPRQAMTFDEAVESGAPLAVWLPKPFDPPTDAGAVRVELQLPVRDDLPSADDLEKMRAAETDRTMLERLDRKLLIRREIGPGPTTPIPVTAWRLGRSLFVGAPTECYQEMQQRIRRDFPDFAVVVTNLTSGYAPGYVVPDALYDGPPIYQVWQTPFGKGTFEQLYRGMYEQLSALAGR